MSKVVGGGIGADSSEDKGAGRKRVCFDGVESKLLGLKQAFEESCVDKCCSRDDHDVVSTRVADKIERDGTYQNVVSSLPGSVGLVPSTGFIRGGPRSSHPPIVLRGIRPR